MINRNGEKKQDNIDLGGKEVIVLTPNVPKSKVIVTKILKSNSLIFLSKFNLY